MKVLMVCQTYNMLIASIQIKRFDLKCDDVDIVLTDDSAGMEQIAANLRATGLFKNVYFVHIKEKYRGGNIIKRVVKIKNIYVRKSKVEQLYGIKNFDYEQFYFCVHDITSLLLYRCISKHNKDVVAHRYEEGYSTYTIFDVYNQKLHYFINVFSLILREPNLYKKTRYIHLFNPNFLLYKNNYERIPIHEIESNDVEFREILNSIFDYNEAGNEFEQAKYIFFEESFFVDKKQKINDYEIVQEIAKVVGKDNLIVKLHPRTVINRFEKLGIRVSQSTLPWEVIQLNHNFSDKCLIAISSGAVLSSKIWFKSDIKVIMMYKCTNKKPMLVSNEYEEYLAKVLGKYGAVGFSIPVSLEDAKACLKY